MVLMHHPAQEMLDRLKISTLEEGSSKNLEFLIVLRNLLAISKTLYLSDVTSGPLDSFNFVAMTVFAALVRPGALPSGRRIPPDWICRILNPFLRRLVVFHAVKESKESKFMSLATERADAVLQSIADVQNDPELKEAIRFAWKG
jgi:hypothetical protein